MSESKRPSFTNEPNRRDFFSGVGVGALVGGMAAFGGWYTFHDRGEQELVPHSDKLGLPGLYPGRVVEVNHPGAVLKSQNTRRGYQDRDQEVVGQMLHQGMCRLVGVRYPDDAWRKFFEPGDRVGIKVVPVGAPDSISSYELVREVIAGLEMAGVKRRDILVFERHRDEFLRCRYHRLIPDDVHWECSSIKYDEAQLEISGQLKHLPRVGNVAGYDRDVYREFGFCLPSHDPMDDRRYRSHLSKIITQKVDKFISIPVLKDHRSAGVTLSLKNLSHGSVNNVARSHGDRMRNQCQTFIPGIASLPQIREKAVLQILDGLVGTYEGGPGNWNRSFATWNYSSLLLATDPVALDHVGWTIIDKKRGEEGWPSVAQMGAEASGGHTPIPNHPTSEQFHIRQPQHVPLAETLGLGTFDMAKIDHKTVKLGPSA